MKKITLFLLIFLHVTNSQEICEDEYFLFSLKNSKPIFDYRVNAFSNFFGDSLFDSTKDGLYIFHELNGVQRLFIVDSSVDFVRIYQLPRTKLLPWLHPDKYMKKRDLLLNSALPRDKCFIQKKINRSFFNILESLDLSSHLYAHPSSQYCDVWEFVDYKMDIKYSILGFQQKKENRKYFYYQKYAGFGRHTSEYFDVYTKVFDLLNPFNETLSFSECK